MAPCEEQRRSRHPKTPEEQHEGQREGQGHTGDLPDQAAVHEGNVRPLSLPRPAGRTLITHPSTSLQGTLQKFVDDVFVAILSTKRPPPIAVRFFFDFLDDMAEKHGIDDPETVHIWKTNR